MRIPGSLLIQQLTPEKYQKKTSFGPKNTERDQRKQKTIVFFCFVVVL